MSTTKTFDVALIAVCMPTFATVPDFDRTVIAYTLGNAQETTTFATWTPTPSVCVFTFQMTVSPSLVDPGLIVFDEPTQTVTIVGTNVFYSNVYVADTYTVTVTALASDSSDTGYSINTVVTVTDPCMSGSITIDASIVSSVNI